MPRSTGTYSPPASSWNPPITSAPATAADWATLLADISSALSQSVSADGQTPITSNIPMGNNKITGLAAATVATDAITFGQTQAAQYSWLSSVSGTDTITANLSTPTLTSYIAGGTYRFIAAATNTGAVTININSLGAKSITRKYNAALIAGDILANSIVTIVYDGTQFQITNMVISQVNELSFPIFKNKLINGCFRIWQRATSQTSSGYGSNDRWHHAHIGATKTHSGHFFTLGQTDVPGNPQYFSRTVVTSVAGAANFCNLLQPIEYVRTLSGKTATLSFWARADALRNIAVDLLQIFGTGGSPSSMIEGIGAQKVLLSTSWQRYSITINIPSITGKTLGSNNNDSLTLRFWFDAGSNFTTASSGLGHQSGTFELAQIQLEEGSVATKFEDRPYSVEFDLCKRYFEAVIANCYAWGSSSLIAFCEYYLKRAIPQFSQMTNNHNYSQSNVTTTTSSYNAAGYTGMWATRTITSAGIGQFSELVAVDAEL